MENWRKVKNLMEGSFFLLGKVALIYEGLLTIQIPESGSLIWKDKQVIWSSLVFHTLDKTFIETLANLLQAVSAEQIFFHKFAFTNFFKYQVQVVISFLDLLLIKCGSKSSLIA